MFVRTVFGIYKQEVALIFKEKRTLCNCIVITMELLLLKESNTDGYFIPIDW